MLSESEQKVMQLKYQSPQIKHLKNIELWGSALVLKIHIITGWALPAEQEFVNILTDQFTKKLLEDYADLNIDEIEFAFRSTGTRVKDWGKSLNLGLIDEVLRPYVTQRYELSAQEERAKNKPEQKIYTLEELDNIHRGDVEAFYQRCLKGIVPPKELPEYYKTILVKDGLITEQDDLHSVFAACINSGRKNIYVRQ